MLRKFLQKQGKQSSIPVGCVPPVSVATTRCQHQGVYLSGGPSSGIPSGLLGGCTFQGVYLLGCTFWECTFQGVYLLGVHLTGGVLRVYLAYPHPEGTWDQAHPHPLWTDKH